jgi:hypothetical protein
MLIATLNELELGLFGTRAGTRDSKRPQQSSIIFNPRRAQHGAAIFSARSIAH